MRYNCLRQEYLERHHLLQYMQSLLHAVIQAKPKATWKLVRVEE